MSILRKLWSLTEFSGRILPVLWGEGIATSFASLYANGAVGGLAPGRGRENRVPDDEAFSRRGTAARTWRGDKAPEGEAFQSGPLASMVAHQQILIMYKGAKDVEILVSYFGKERSTEA